MRRKWVLAAVVAFPMAFVGWIAWTVFTTVQYGKHSTAVVDFSAYDV
ncbi:hypothetical protein [Streptomyces mirabilis]|nr:hypothetical protein [Streptomyces mirabilis]